MKARISKLLSIILLGFLVVGCSAASGSKLIGKPAPLSRVTLLDGDIVALDQFVGHGKPAVLAFWATTCSYSPRAIESLDRIAVKLKPQGVQFLAISIDKSDAIEKLHGMVKYREMKNLTHCYSGNDVYDEAYISYDGGELPYFVVIDGQGTVVAAGNKASVVEDYFKPS